MSLPAYLAKGYEYIAKLLVQETFMTGVVSGAAAGTTLATATQLTAPVNVVTSWTTGTATGVKLPPWQLGLDVTVIVTVASAAVKIYPYESASTIDGGSAGAAITLTNGASGSVSVNLIASSSGAWLSYGKGTNAS